MDFVIPKSKEIRCLKWIANHQPAKLLNEVIQPRFIPISFARSHNISAYFKACQMYRHGRGLQIFAANKPKKKGRLYLYTVISSMKIPAPQLNSKTRHQSMSKIPDDLAKGLEYLTDFSFTKKTSSTFGVV